MNREIKFRAWDEQNKVMHNDFQFVKSGNNGNDWILFVSDKQPFTEFEGGRFWYNNPYFKQQLKVMQFTGLKDKNRKEIYDGDICITGKGHYFRVSWSNNKSRFSGITREELAGRRRYKSIEWISKNCVVIGNAYENPELL